MKKLLAATATTLLLLTSTTAQAADPKVKGWKTHDSMGCMMTRDCQNGVIEITTTSQVAELLNSPVYDDVQEEADGIIRELKTMGVGVFLADDKYFLQRQVGVYFTVGNDLFLNGSYVNDPEQYIETLRHEAWHAAQDAMAGSIANPQIAIIYPEEDVPRGIRIQARLAYGPYNPSLPWETEGKWAGATKGMTLRVLEIINRTDNKPWTEITPTPMTREWLENNGYM